jgi:inorganic pyrophosphatase
MSQDMKKLIFYIEIPAHSSVKYEVDEETGILMADRFLHTQMTYPTNYGYIVGTKGKDGDPVDVLVLSSQAVVPGIGIKGHIIGMLEMEDEEGIDTKIIAVPDKKVDPIYGTWESIADVPKHVLDRIKHFFDHYKELEPGKFVKTHDFKSREEAEKEVLASFVEEDDCCGDCCDSCSCGDDKSCGCEDKHCECGSGEGKCDEHCSCNECKTDDKKEMKKKK